MGSGHHFPWSFSVIIGKDKLNCLRRGIYRVADVQHLFTRSVAVLLSSRPGLGLEDTWWRSWPWPWMIRSWHLRSWPWPWEKSHGLGLAKTFSPRSRPRVTCMLCSHSRCHITVCNCLLRGIFHRPACKLDVGCKMNWIYEVRAVWCQCV